MLLKRHGGGSDKLIKKLIFASMAQLVEQLIRNEQVVGSNPTTSSTAAWFAVCPPIHLYGSEGFVMLAAEDMV